MPASERPRLKLDASMALFAEAQRLSPGGVMGIRRPYNFVQGEYPIFIERGYGGHIVDVDGNDYIDMLCGYGPIILGYREPEIDAAVIAQVPPTEAGFSEIWLAEGGLLGRLVLRDDGTMMRLTELQAFGERLHMPVCTVADLVAYRLRTEKLVHEVAVCVFPARDPHAQVTRPRQQWIAGRGGIGRRALGGVL